MCLHLWERMRSHRRLQHRTRRASTDHSQATTSSYASSAFTSHNPFSMSSTTSGSVAGGLVKNIVFQGPLFYKLPEIAAATLNFAASQQIGSSAWKGTLRDSSVAIIQKSGVAHSFRKLLANVCVLHHSNLARVMGGCRRTADSIFVVYEFVDGGDLQACLHNTIVPGYTALSTWRLRMQVALDVAKGLEYVHQHTASLSAHKYLTSSSVLLTKDTLRAKLALVGIAALTGEVVATEDEEALSPGILDKDPQEGDFLRSVKIKGTHGYMPPEYINFGSISQKYDVFTYGVVLLELLKGQVVGAQAHSGQKRALNSMSIVEEVRSLMENTEGMRGRVRLWMDTRLKDSYPVEDAVKVVWLALSCVSDNPQKRPAMSKVALEMAQFFDSAVEWERQRTMVTQSGTLQGR